ncbi:MAG: L-histidine N(alpha)-methyltransferase [Cyanobacteriota bacterium]|nr:L-histidine N(alpha)-methyltransferase [Cyanobacteriota bacterium]
MTAPGDRAPQQPNLMDLHPEPADMARLVREGMARTPKQLPAWFLYDETGSHLFERICEQPEYTLTRTETELLRRFGADLASALGPGALVEFGAGNGRKVSPLLMARRQSAFVALDISHDHLSLACDQLRTRHPWLPILGICCDYSSLAALPDHPLLRQRRLGFYPGGSLGNFDPLEASRLLEHFATLLGDGSRLLIGIDQPKAVARLEAAYNDAAGWSAAFARNLLHRLNRELGGDFDPGAFLYDASWDAERSRIAMALVSQQPQRVSLAGGTFHFGAGEPLITEYSVKYAPEAFLALARGAGWRPMGRWSDSAEDVSLHLLERNDTRQSV